MPTPNTPFFRRAFLRQTGKLLIAIPAVNLIACGGGSNGTTTSDTTSTDSTTDSTTTDTSSGSAESLTQDNSAVDWASGGTDSMSVEYPNPFDEGYGNVCDLTDATTEGPCYSDTVEREDISEGLDGLPTRLCFRVVDANCNPVEGATVDIWHCDTDGIYSGDGMQSVNFCTGGDADHINNDYFRGTQTTDADGVVWFSTCFPGWYSSRAVHIHFMVIINGQTYVTSQVGFEDSLVDEILTSHSVYKSRGIADTHNYDDTVFPSSGYEGFLMDTHKMSDGSMLAWKTLMVSA